MNEFKYFYYIRTDLVDRKALQPSDILVQNEEVYLRLADIVHSVYTNPSSFYYVPPQFSIGICLPLQRFCRVLYKDGSRVLLYISKVVGGWLISLDFVIFQIRLKGTRRYDFLWISDCSFGFTLLDLYGMVAKGILQLLLSNAFAFIGFHYTLLNILLIAIRFLATATHVDVGFYFLQLLLYAPHLLQDPLLQIVLFKLFELLLDVLNLIRNGQWFLRAFPIGLFLGLRSYLLVELQEVLLHSITNLL